MSTDNKSKILVALLVLCGKGVWQDGKFHKENLD